MIKSPTQPGWIGELFSGREDCAFRKRGLSTGTARLTKSQAEGGFAESSDAAIANAFRRTRVAASVSEYFLSSSSRTHAVSETSLPARASANEFAKVVHYHEVILNAAGGIAENPVENLD